MLRVAFVLCLLTACVTAPPEPRYHYIDPRPPIQVVADSTTWLVFYAIQASDTAMLRSQYALTEKSLQKARALVNDARISAETAEQNVRGAIEKGDRIKAAVTPQPGEPVTRKANYNHYWELSRAKLDTAWVKTRAAQAIADSALVCTATSCTAVRARDLRSLLMAASGAAREAQSLIRIAVIYLKPEG
jgi:hypothetical protein